MFLVGLDLGQSNDYTAVAILEMIKGELEIIYHLRHLARFALQTPYPAIVADVQKMLAALKGESRLIIDNTGVGRPVADLLRQSGLNPVAVSITGGNSVTSISGGYGVPKRDLVFSAKVLLQTGRLKFAPGLNFIDVFVAELMNFKVKISETGHDSYEAWRESVHDDLVLAVCLGTWYATRFAPRLAPIEIVEQTQISRWSMDGRRPPRSRWGR